MLKGKDEYWCEECDELVKKKQRKHHEISTKHKDNAIRNAKPFYEDKFLKVVPLETSFKSRILTLLIKTKRELFIVEDFLKIVKFRLFVILRNNLRETNSLKFNLKLICKYVDKDGNNTEAAFKMGNLSLLSGNQILKKIRIGYEKILSELDVFQGRGSNWSLREIVGLEVAVNKFFSLRSGHYIPLPKDKKLCRRMVINVRNEDDKCFYYCILAKFLYRAGKQNLHRVGSYKYTENFITVEFGITFDFNGIEFPTSFGGVRKFVKQNPLVSVNIFGVESDERVIYPLSVCDEERVYHYDLLYLKDGCTSHYCYITNFDAFIRSQLTKNQGKIAACKRCLAYFGGKDAREKLKSHNFYCSKYTNQPARYYFPKRNENILEFKKACASQLIDFACFADFETMLVPMTEDDEKTFFRSTSDPFHSHCNTRKTHRHVPIAFCYYIVGPDNAKYVGPEYYVGRDCVSVFVRELQDRAREIAKFYKNEPKPPTLTDEENERFLNQKNCGFCARDFVPNVDIRVRHHNHVTGKFVFAAHRDCNLQASHPNFLPVVLHNFSRYDGHFIALECGETKKPLSVIPSTEETYIALTLYVSENFSIRFIDSYRFLATSLRNLTNILPNDKFIHTEYAFPDPSQFRIAKKKNFFPYEFLDNESKLELNCLPPHADFYSSLQKGNISPEEYLFALEAWKILECRTLKDYLIRYCIIDVLLLADCFQSFRETCFLSYNIDPLYSFSLPGYTLDAFLKSSDVKLELITDADMYLFFESSIRGGMTNTICRHVKANNPEVPGYNPALPPISILYLDACNLYGSSMLEPIPTCNFRFLTEYEIRAFSAERILSIPPDAETGFFFEVDLDYPPSLHDKHNDLPLCPEKKCPPGSNVRKLLCTLEPKSEYVLHYRVLQFCLAEGLILKKIRRIVSFRQESVLKNYISLNAKFRKESTNDFSKSLYKMMINSLFGKFIENVRERINFELVTDEKVLSKRLRSAFFKSSTIFSENLVGISRYKKNQKLDKPIYIGSTILELSKLHMFNFFYTAIPKIFPAIPVKLLYMDTDSFILAIKSKNLIPRLKQFSLEYFDCSDYREDHPLYNQVNAKVLGKFKNELPNCHIVEFISLCPKVYAIQCTSSKSIKKVKGVQKMVVRNEIRFKDFLEILYGKSKSVSKLQRHFISKKHIVYTIEQNKIALSLQDDKRVWLNNDHLNSYAYGYNAKEM